MEQKEHQKPVKKIRVGTVSATIWENAGRDGTVFASVQLERSYKDDTAGTWKSTTSLRQSDLGAATLALNEAYRYLALVRQEPESA